jgi:hypothetical protein
MTDRGEAVASRGAGGRSAPGCFARCPAIDLGHGGRFPMPAIQARMPSGMTEVNLGATAITLR